MTEKDKEMLDKAKEWVEDVAGSVKDESEKSRSRDKVEGTVHKAKGRLKEAAGALTGDEARKAEGISDQTKGDAPPTVSDWGYGDDQTYWAKRARVVRPRL